MRNARLHVNARRERGFSIIEALISGLVLSFGMMALVGVQVSLSRNGDVAKQRTEATRLAQEKMEQLRAYQSDEALTGATAFATLENNSPEAAVTLVNTAFTRSWTVLGGATDPERRIRVSVAWTDRAGAAQTVSLSSSIARTNHTRVGLIMANVSSSGFAGVRQQRDNAVPFPAIDIGGGRSTYQWPGTSIWYVFSNTDASVLYKCTSQPTSPASVDSPACVGVRGYVVAGYLSVAAPNNPNSATNIDTVLSPWSINACSIASPTNVDVATCFVANVISSGAINPNCPYLATGATAPSGDEIERLSFYKCYAAIVELANPNGTGWGGKMTFTTAPTGDDSICRFSHNLVNSSGFYVNVEQSLSNENYFARTNYVSHHQACANGQSRHQP